MDDKIRCIYNYMQSIKVDINELDMYVRIFENQITFANKSEEELNMAYLILSDKQKIEKLKFIFKCIFTLGIYYFKNKEDYKRFNDILLDQLDENEYKYDNIVESLGVYEIERIRLKARLNECHNYYKQMEMFLNAYNSMTEDEKQILIFKQN